MTTGQTIKMGMHVERIDDGRRGEVVFIAKTGDIVSAPMFVGDVEVATSRSTSVVTHSSVFWKRWKLVTGFDRDPRPGDRLMNERGERVRVLRRGKRPQDYVVRGDMYTSTITVGVGSTWRIVGERVGFVVRDGTKYLMRMRWGQRRDGMLVLGGNWTHVASSAQVFPDIKGLATGRRVARVRYLPGFSPSRTCHPPS